MSIYSGRSRKPDSNGEGDLEKWLGSYSDLFANLSIVFLLLYVTIFVQNITLMISGSAETKRVVQRHQQEIEELTTHYDRQLQAYQEQKERYLDAQATQGEREAHAQALARLSELEETKRGEIDEQMQALTAAQEKLREVASYKTLVKNIIDSRAVAESRILELEQAKKDVETQKALAEQKLREFQQQFDERLVAQLEAEKEALRKELARLDATRESNLKAGLKLARSELRQSFDAERTKERAELEARQTAERTRLQGEIDRIGGDLDTLRAVKTRRQKAIGEIAGALESAFAGAGVAAQTDAASGEVVIYFPEAYFDYGSSRLKPEMQAVLQKAVPVYASTVFGNRRFASRIGSVEIVGFASPTFGRRYVDPRAMTAEARRALNYNMDLSYRRARAIFEFISDPRSIKFEHQRDMLLLTKVSGRSYLAAKPAEMRLGKTTATRTLAGDLPAPAPGAPTPADLEAADAAAREAARTAGPEQFCQVFNCAAEQRVAIRFHLADPTFGETR